MKLTDNQRIWLIIAGIALVIIAIIYFGGLQILINTAVVGILCWLIFRKLMWPYV